MIELHDLLRAERPADTKLCWNGEIWLDDIAFRTRVNTIRAHLRKQSISRYALCVSDSFEFACALFALLAAGKTIVIPASTAPDYLSDLAHCFDRILTDDDLAAGSTAQDTTSSAAEPARIAPNASITLYTSGSSGSPKAIVKTLAQLDREVRTLEYQWGSLIGNATIIAGVPHHHIYGLLFRILWPLAAGRPFDTGQYTQPGQVRQHDEHRAGTVLVSTPAQLTRWPELPGFDLLASGLRAIFSSGGPLSQDAAQCCADRLAVMPIEIYGSTETGGIAWRQQYQTDIWQALPGIDVRREEDGVLAVRSPHLAHDAWYRTDDGLVMEGPNRFRLLGRLDRVAKLAGKRVSLPELEARLAAHPYVAQAAVTPLSSGDRERIGVLLALTPKGNEALQEVGRVMVTKQLRRHLSAYFEPVVLPRYWRFRQALPFDGRGKLPSAAVIAAFGPRTDGVELLSEARVGDLAQYDLRVPAGLVHFAGHFPGLPILPGVVMLDWAFSLAAEHQPAIRQFSSIERLKFLAPVLPGANLRLVLKHDRVRHRVAFSFLLDGKDCVSGVIVHGGPI